MKRLVILVQDFSDDCQYRLDEIPDPRTIAPLPQRADAIIEVKAVNGASVLALHQMCCGTIPSIDVDAVISASEGRTPFDESNPDFQEAHLYHLGVLGACDSLDNIDVSPLKDGETRRDVSELMRIVNCRMGIAGIVSYGRDIVNAQTPSEVTEAESAATAT